MHDCAAGHGRWTRAPSGRSEISIQLGQRATAAEGDVARPTSSVSVGWRPLLWALERSSERTNTHNFRSIHHVNSRPQQYAWPCGEVGRRPSFYVARAQNRVRACHDVSHDRVRRARGPKIMRSARLFFLWKSYSGIKPRHTLMRNASGARPLMRAPIVHVLCTDREWKSCNLWRSERFGCSSVCTRAAEHARHVGLAN